MSGNKFSRRGFLKTLGLTVGAMALEPTYNKVQAANNIVERNNKPSAGGLPVRTLGSGDAAFDVSALGFGVMGMTYNRSLHPDKKQCIRLLHEAVDRGITLFDTAIIYGPLTNELLAGMEGTGTRSSANSCCRRPLLCRTAETSRILENYR